ncbi:hypothetical protein yinte0001_37540 [Yersinia intermedia ATCC 29909]|nr:hypothetical protein yinte0001_37540 [Yersinia intermedia ATCC 29909]
MVMRMKNRLYIRIFIEFPLLISVILRLLIQLVEYPQR